MGNSNPKPKPTEERNTAARSAQNPATGVNRQPPAHSFVQPPRNNVTSEEELAQLGFSAYTGHPIDTRSTQIERKPKNFIQTNFDEIINIF